MGKTKELLDQMNYKRPDWMYDAEYQEWLEWAERPVKYDKDEEAD